MRKKREILFNFWQTEKYKNIRNEIDFFNQRKKERKKERTTNLKSKKSLVKTIAE